jgi:hypothetical protein
LAYLHISVFAYLCNEQNHEALPENTKDTIQKKMILKILLRICVFVFEPKKSVLRFLFFSFFSQAPQGPAKLKRELSLNHLQRPIARCGPNQGEIDISPSRIQLGLSRDTLLLPIGHAAPALGPSCC